MPALGNDGRKRQKGQAQWPAPTNGFWKTKGMRSTRRT